MYYRNTDGIRITVTPRFSPEHSDVAEPRFVFVYHIRIENTSSGTVQLRWRHWYIHDELAGDSEVEGEGVIGEQPVLAPCQSYEYTSGTPLPTPSGIMVGSYDMELPDGECFAVAVPAFSLDSPHQPRRLN